METIRTRAVKAMFRFIFQVRFAGSVVLAGALHTSHEFDRAVLSSILGFAVTRIVRLLIVAFPVNARPAGKTN